jgi:hypothetical protein
MHNIKEFDWKIFKGIREVALERFCERVLDEIGGIGSDATKAKHQRYLAIHKGHSRDLYEANGGRARGRGVRSGIRPHGEEARAL